MYAQKVIENQTYFFWKYQQPENLDYTKESFTNYIDKFLAFFDHLSPFINRFYLIKVDNFGLSTHLFL